jgi:hypothetical protein
MPNLLRLAPASAREWITERCTRPAGAAWLRDRLDGLSVSSGLVVTGASADADGVKLTLSGGSSRRVDHVLLATGYAVDIARYGFLDPDLLARIDTVKGSPVLGAGLESTVPGLYFLGAPAAHSFGPVMRFVVGTWHAGPALARHIAGRRPSPFSVAFPTSRTAL